MSEIRPSPGESRVAGNQGHLPQEKFAEQTTVAHVEPKICMMASPLMNASRSRLQLLPVSRTASASFAHETPLPITELSSPRKRPQRETALPFAAPSAASDRAGKAEGATTAGAQPLPAEAGRRREPFLPRPVTVRAGHDAWTAMRASLGEAYDVRMAGRPIDGSLLYELARHRRDIPEARVLVAELAGVGALDGTAFEQISHNVSLRGSSAPFIERVAFALAVNAYGGAEARQKYSAAVSSLHSTEGGEPLRVLHSALGVCVPFGSWSHSFVRHASALLADARQRRLPNSLTFGALLRVGVLGEGGVPARLAAATTAELIAYRLARRMGANERTALSIARRTRSGELDLTTLQMLTPGSPREQVRLSAHIGNTAVVGRISVFLAAEIAAAVARGELSSGQIYGFYLTYGRSPEDSPQFALDQVVAMITAVNRGALDPAQLSTVLSPQSYLSTEFWSSFRSQKPDGSYEGPAALSELRLSGPLTRRLTGGLVTELAGDVAKLRIFSREFQRVLSEALPYVGRLRVDPPAQSAWEHQAYDGAVQTAFEAAVAKLSEDDDWSCPAAANGQTSEREPVGAIGRALRALERHPASIQSTPF